MTERISAAVLATLAACSVPDARDTRAPHDPQVAATPGLRLPDDLTPVDYALRLELDPDLDTFRGTVTIHAWLERATDRFWIHADQLEITSARFGDDHAELAPLGTGDEMRAFGFGRTLPRGDVTFDFAFTGHATRDEEGVFRQRDRDRWYMFTQSESVLARRILPCFDEPRFKTPWQVTLVVPAGDVALANAAKVGERALPDGRREVAFAPTPPMPSYLLAAAVGPFELVDAGVVGRARVPVRVAALRGDRGEVAVVAARLPAIVAALEAYTDEPLPWPKLDLVAVPHLFGAMENAGLFTFDKATLTGDAKQLASRFVHVAAHEVAHEWFGNLVTPAWWDDLWLSEALASWLAGKVAAQLGESADPALDAALAREHALEADAAPGARALRPPILHNTDPDSAGFSAISYDKGAAVLAMFERWLGEDVFRGALRGYLARHRDGIATESDVVAALGGGALGAAFAQYVERVGAPIVELAVRCDAAGARVEARARDGRVVPVCVRDSAGQRACALVGDRTQLPLAACPAWIVGNAGGLAYYEVVAAAPPVAALSPAERVAFGDDVAAALGRGDVAAPAALATVTALARAKERVAAYAALAIARVLDDAVPARARAAWGAWLVERFADRLAAPVLLAPPADDLDADLRDELLDLVPADQLPAAATRAARVELARAPSRELAMIANDPAACERIAAAARSAPVDARAAALDALGGCGAEVIAHIVELLPAGDPAWEALAGLFARAATRGAAWRAVRPRVAELIPAATPAQAAELVDAVAKLCDAGARAEVAAAFAPVIARVPDGKAMIERALAEIDRCVARRQRIGEVVP